LVVVCGVLGFACGQSPRATAARNGGDVASDLTLEWTMTPNPPTVGTDTVGEVTMRDRSRRPVRGATIQIECHMSHPGMAPVIGQATERSEGVYQVPLRFSMIGEWGRHRERHAPGRAPLRPSNRNGHSATGQVNWP
jgi:hypothetical protein